MKSFNFLSLIYFFQYSELCNVKSFNFLSLIYFFQYSVSVSVIPFPFPDSGLRIPYFSAAATGPGNSFPAPPFLMAREKQYMASYRNFVGSWMQPTLFINSAGKTKIPGVVSGIIPQSVSFVILHFHRQRLGLFASDYKNICEWFIAWWSNGVKAVSRLK